MTDRGKRFTIDDDDVVDDGRIDRYRRADTLGRQAQREYRELERFVEWAAGERGND
ncbi:hypothetical protein [Haloterrigena turkmenica]|uniref:hypothetical protein n=1 Tax=Haloterrigena turkmenica TaxID=62320 RepID=UPI000AE0502C|nr:hypothetical protein [Haloterrigena turkmenica]